MQHLSASDLMSIESEFLSACEDNDRIGNESSIKIKKEPVFIEGNLTIKNFDSKTRFVLGNDNESGASSSG